MKIRNNINYLQPRVRRLVMIVAVSVLVVCAMPQVAVSDNRSESRSESRSETRSESESEKQLKDGSDDRSEDRVNPFRGVGIDQKLGVQIPLDATFNDENGKKVSLRDLLQGKPIILHLVYFRCPKLCNLSIQGLLKALRALSFDAGDEFTMITVSFDPREGPALAAAAKETALRRYGRKNVEDDWHFLTGKKSEIDKLAEAVGFRYRYDSQTGQYAHAAGLIVLTPEGRVSRYLLDVEYSPRDLRLSLVEASDNKIGSITDQVLLLCYQYNPKTGKYGLLIQNVLRGAGVLTLLVMATGIGIMLRRETKKQKNSPGGAADGSLGV